MKKAIFLVMLVAGISRPSFAQQAVPQTNSDRIFDLSNYSFRRVFILNLDKGNKLEVSLNNVSDLARFNNMDSVLRVFLQDISPLKDSLSDELSSKRIDYLVDSMGRKKIRIQQFKPKGASFVISNGDASALKLEQDTINFIGAIRYMAKFTLRAGFEDIRYFQVRFVVNNISDLAAYTDGRLNIRIINLQKNADGQWFNQRNGMFTDHDRDVLAKQPRGYLGMGDFLELKISVNAQNYKNYFVPSFSLGTAFIITTQGVFKREIGFSWEPNFFFAKNAEGSLHVFRNDFLTLNYGQGPVKDHDPRKESPFLTVFSIGYLITRNGNYMEKGTIRIGAGSLSLFEGKTKIEPMLYFTDLFKGVTPGIRWIQSF